MILGKEGFDPRLHTPDALAAQLGEVYESEPNLVVVGSLGRALHFGAITENFTTEYDARGESPLHHQGEARDIDVISSVSDPVTPTGPFPVDRTFLNSRVKVTHDGTDWWLTSNTSQFAERIHPDTMASVEGATVYDAPIRTIPLRTLLALQAAPGYVQSRPKDVIALSLMEELLKDVSPQSSPSSLYEPFERLRTVREQDRALRLRYFYRTHVPEPVRKILALNKVRHLKDRLT